MQASRQHCLQAASCGGTRAADSSLSAIVHRPNRCPCSCVLDSDGTPVLLYTGVRLRSNLEAGPLPPPEHDLGMVWIETQLAAVPEDPGGYLLQLLFRVTVSWLKLSEHGVLVRRHIVQTPLLLSTASYTGFATLHLHPFL